MALTDGVTLVQAPADWQILQQDGAGVADLPLTGRWAAEDRRDCRVFVRLVRSADAAPVAAHLDWTAAETRADGTWSLTLPRIPAGGLYRVETHLRTDKEPCSEWAIHGEARDFLGVGDLWVIAGQSNAAGYGKGPCDDAPELGIHLFGNDRRWRLARQPLADGSGADRREAINCEWANPGHAPWLAFAKRLRRDLGHPIGLIATALGGSPLSRWNPGEHADPAQADLCACMLRAVAQAGGRVRGMVWYQGCSDTGPGKASTYLARFTTAVAAWRAALGDPALPIITVQLDRVTAPQTPEVHDGWSQVREAQRQAARRLAGVAVVPASDLPLSDLIHVSPAGNLVLGARAAEAALALVHGCDLAWRAPEVESARRGEDGASIHLEVAHVAGRLRPADASGQPFTVSDADGAVGIVGIDHPSQGVVLRLARSLSGAATVSGGAGAHPPLLPVDMTRNLPLLCFHRLPVA